MKRLPRLIPLVIYTRIAGEIKVKANMKAMANLADFKLNWEYLESEAGEVKKFRRWGNVARRRKP